MRWSSLIGFRSNNFEAENCFAPFLSSDGNWSCTLSANERGVRFHSNPLTRRRSYFCYIPHFTDSSYRYVLLIMRMDFDHYYLTLSSIKSFAVELIFSPSVSLCIGFVICQLANTVFLKGKRRVKSNRSLPKGSKGIVHFAQSLFYYPWTYWNPSKTAGRRLRWAGPLW